MASDQMWSGEGNILSITHAGILHSFMPEDISGISRGLQCEKGKSVTREGSNSTSLISFCYSVAGHHTPTKMGGGGEGFSSIIDDLKWMAAKS
jgi:hypothetical protein